MSNSTIFLVSTLIGIFLPSIFNYLLKKFLNVSSSKSINYAMALTSAITFIGGCIDLVYMGIHQIIYINPVGMSFPGLFLGLTLFETLRLAQRKITKNAIPIFLHHIIFITFLILINYDGHVHALMAIIWLQTITNVFFDLLIVTPYSDSTRQKIQFFYNLSFIVFRLMGVIIFNIIFFLYYFSILHSSRDIDLTVYMPMILIASLIFNCYVWLRLSRNRWQVKYKGPEIFLN